MKEAHEVFQARALLEPRTARAAAERTTPADIALLEKHIKDEHEALDRNQPGLALKLSGDFHLEITRIADQQTIEQFLRQLVSRSSLVIALYWQRRNALCESNAHHTLVAALRNNDGAAAEELMKGHLLDIYSQLDLREQEEGSVSLRDALRRQSVRQEVPCPLTVAEAGPARHRKCAASFERLWDDRRTRHPDTQVMARAALSRSRVVCASATSRVSGTVALSKKGGAASWGMPDYQLL